MIDLEINEAIYRFHRGIEVNAETCAVDLINELLFCEKQTYLESEHTAAHFRERRLEPAAVRPRQLRPHGPGALRRRKDVAAGRRSLAQAGGEPAAAGRRAGNGAGD